MSWLVSWALLPSSPQGVKLVVRVSGADLLWPGQGAAGGGSPARTSLAFGKRCSQLPGALDVASQHRSAFLLAPGWPQLRRRPLQHAS